MADNKKYEFKTNYTKKEFDGEVKQYPALPLGLSKLTNAFEDSGIKANFGTAQKPMSNDVIAMQAKNFVDNLSDSDLTSIVSDIWDKGIKGVRSTGSVNGNRSYKVLVHKGGDGLLAVNSNNDNNMPPNIQVYRGNSVPEATLDYNAIKVMAGLPSNDTLTQQWEAYRRERNLDYLEQLKKFSRTQSLYDPNFSEQLVNEVAKAIIENRQLTTKSNPNELLDVNKVLNNNKVNASIGAYMVSQYLSNNPNTFIEYLSKNADGSYPKFNADYVGKDKVGANGFFVHNLKDPEFKEVMQDILRHHIHAKGYNIPNFNNYNEAEFTQKAQNETGLKIDDGKVVSLTGQARQALNADEIAKQKAQMQAISKQRAEQNQLIDANNEKIQDAYTRVNQMLVQAEQFVLRHYHGTTHHADNSPINRGDHRQVISNHYVDKKYNQRFDDPYTNLTTMMADRSFTMSPNAVRDGDMRMNDSGIKKINERMALLAKPFNKDDKNYSPAIALDNRNENDYMANLVSATVYQTERLMGVAMTLKKSGKAQAQEYGNQLVSTIKDTLAPFSNGKEIVFTGGRLNENNMAEFKPLLVVNQSNLAFHSLMDKSNNPLTDFIPDKDGRVIKDTNNYSKNKATLLLNAIDIKDGKLSYEVKSQQGFWLNNDGSQAKLNHTGAGKQGLVSIVYDPTEAGKGNGYTKGAISLSDVSDIVLVEGVATAMTVAKTLKTQDIYLNPKITKPPHISSVFFDQAELLGQYQARHKDETIKSFIDPLIEWNASKPKSIVYEALDKAVAYMQDNPVTFADDGVSPMLLSRVKADNGKPLVAELLTNAQTLKHMVKDLTVSLNKNQSKSPPIQKTSEAIDTYQPMIIDELKSLQGVLSTDELKQSVGNYIKDIEQASSQYAKGGDITSLQTALFDLNNLKSNINDPDFGENDTAKTQIDNIINNPYKLLSENLAQEKVKMLNEQELLKKSNKATLVLSATDIGNLEVVADYLLSQHHKMPNVRLSFIPDTDLERTKVNEQSVLVQGKDGKPVNGVGLDVKDRLENKIALRTSLIKQDPLTADDLIVQQQAKLFDLPLDTPKLRQAIDYKLTTYTVSYKEPQVFVDNSHYDKAVYDLQNNIPNKKQSDYDDSLENLNGDYKALSNLMYADMMVGRERVNELSQSFDKQMQNEHSIKTLFANFDEALETKQLEQSNDRSPANAITNERQQHNDYEPSL